MAPVRRFVLALLILPVFVSQVLPLTQKSSQTESASKNTNTNLTKPSAPITVGTSIAKVRACHALRTARQFLRGQLPSVEMAVTASAGADAVLVHTMAEWGSGFDLCE
jgi:hypothetical protein